MKHAKALPFIFMLGICGQGCNKGLSGGGPAVSGRTASLPSATSTTTIASIPVPTPAPTPTPTPGHPPVAAQLLGQTGEDFVGPTSMGPDGVLDVHLRLSNVSGTLSDVRITGSANGIWVSPFNGSNWIVDVVPSADPTVVDIFFDYYVQNSNYTVVITYSDGQQQAIQTMVAPNFIPAGFFRSQTDFFITGSIYYSNGSHYCGIPTWDKYLAMGGNPDANQVLLVPSIPPIMVYDGTCQ